MSSLHRCRRQAAADAQPVSCGTRVADADFAYIAISGALGVREAGWKNKEGQAILEEAEKRNASEWPYAIVRYRKERIRYRGVITTAPGPNGGKKTELMLHGNGI